MDGQADNAPGNLDDLASFIEEQSPEDSDQQDSDAKPVEDSEEQPEQEEDAVDESTDDESEDENAKDQPSVKYKVPIKGEDGSDTTIEVDQKELIAGYQRQADYTRKTQELAAKEGKAFEVVTTEIEKSRSYFMEQARLARAAVAQLANLKSEDELAQLAHNDPAAWVAEQQRANALNGFMQNLERGMQHEAAQSQQMQAAKLQQEFGTAWKVLSEKGIDRPKLQSIYEKAQKYGFSQNDFSGVYDPRVVLMMRDAVAYQELKNKQPEVSKKAANAPKLPASRQPVPRNEAVIKKLDSRFKGGKAKLDDLAAYLNARNI